MSDNNKEEFSELIKRLIKRLRSVYNDDNFIIGVLSYVWESEEDQQTIINFIDAGEDVDDETVIVLAMNLCDIREGME